MMTHLEITDNDLPGLVFLINPKTLQMEGVQSENYFNHGFQWEERDDE